MKNSALSFLMALSLIFSVFGFSSLLSSCATSQRTYDAGAVLGGPAGSLVDRENSWRGGVLGAAIGGVLAGTVTEISARAAVEAAEEGRPVIYQSADGYQRVEETPVSYNAEAKCHKVRESIWQEGQLVKDEVKEVCQSEKKGYLLIQQQQNKLSSQ